MAKSQQPDAGRRRFLRDSLTAGAATVAVTAAASAATFEPATPETAEPAKPEAKGYRLTRHIADYYKTAAF